MDNHIHYEMLQVQATLDVVLLFLPFYSLQWFRRVLIVWLRGHQGVIDCNQGLYVDCKVSLNLKWLE